MSEQLINEFLNIRRHLKIVHHVPGRIRLRVSASLFKEAKGIDKQMVDRVINAIEGISDVRINAVAATLVITYVTKILKPDWWTDLIEANDDKASALFDQLLETKLSSAVQAAQDS